MLPSSASCRSAVFPSYAFFSLSKTTTSMRSIQPPSFVERSEDSDRDDAHVVSMRQRGYEGNLTISTGDDTRAAQALALDLDGSSPTHGARSSRELRMTLFLVAFVSRIS